jgi:eukaryotic-like serine/threonine-protein kinase
MNELLNNQPDPLDAVVEEFLGRCRGGQLPSAEEYAHRHPDLAERIRSLFPALLLLEGGPRPAASTLPAQTSVDSLAAGGTPALLGPFHIVREVGRGGMGVVYEAVQEPLGRRVALKVLPPECARRPSYRERFSREAGVAARLHHTNIVPVFASGEHDGTLYFAMQFIDGHTVAELIAELRAQGKRPAGHFPWAARLALQAAEALACAHAHGVLHRDIKPANLLVDEAGTLWVADFGLAKAGDADDLTGSGELVGTLRYLTPERFAGRSDARSDVYALGATLYEMIALRPAFDETDRLRLVQQVVQGAPPLRQAAPGVQSDLETVVRKAMAADPADRYPTAQDLADDLRLFLADQPVKARRASAWERLRRWARHNPALAGMSAAAGLLALVLVAGSLAAAWRLNRVAERALGAEHDATERLFEALRARAEAGLTSARPGQRFDSLEALRQAAQIAREQGRPAEDLVKLRSEAIACLALPDFRLDREWEGNPPGTNGLAFDTRFERYAWSFADEGVRVCRAADHRELFRLPTRPASRASRWLRLSFSPDGRYLALFYSTWAAKHPLEVWDLGADKAATRVPMADALADVTCPPAFAADGRTMFAGLQDGTVARIDLRSGKEAGRLPPGWPAMRLVLNPDGRLLAATSTGPPGVQIRELPSGRVVRELPQPLGVETMAWQPGGDLLAVGCDDHHIYLWDGRIGDKRGMLIGHRWGIHDLAFDSTGRWLVSFGWDMTLRAWDVSSRRQVLEMKDVRVMNFSSEGGLLVAALLAGRQVRIWSFHPSDVHHVLYGHLDNLREVKFSRDGRWLATVQRKGDLRLWDVGSRRQAGSFPDLAGPAWESDGASLLTFGPKQLLRWPVRPLGPQGADGIRLGPARAVPGPIPPIREGSAHWCWRGPRDLFVSGWDRSAVALYEVAETIREKWSTKMNQVAYTAASPDGRWVAAGSIDGGSGVAIWEADTGRLAKELPIGDASVAFSPDGRWLYTATSRIAPEGPRVCAWRVGTWELQRGQALDRSASTPAGLTASPDGAVVAVPTSQDGVRLLVAGLSAELATLTAPETGLVGAIQFSPDSGMLALAASHLVHLWDLRHLRRELAEVGLDWDAPPYPAQPAPAPRPLQVEVDPGMPQGSPGSNF